VITQDDIDGFSHDKDVFPDGRRSLEYKERLREALVLEEYYKLKSDYPDKEMGDLLILAAERTRAKEE
jgi:hypothetical protein